MYEIVDIEAVQDLDYLTRVMNETLRFQSPAICTSQMEVSKDTKVGNIMIKKGDSFIIDFYALHYDQA